VTAVASQQSPGAALGVWFATNGRHHVPWRSGRSRWEVLVAEVMCCQTQLDRVVAALDPFLAKFPTPEAAVAAGQSALVAAWGRLGYPRRAQALFRAATHVVQHGWPEDLTTLDGVGPWVAAATAAQADDADVFAFDVNVRRLAQRLLGTVAADRVLIPQLLPLLEPLSGRTRLLAALDLAAICCTRREPSCGQCPLASVCVSNGPLPGESLPTRQARYAGSLRQRRGDVLDVLRSAPAPASSLPADALESLCADGLVVVDVDVARLA
jgi:A/G-specific adenine glycosylase